MSLSSRMALAGVLLFGAACFVGGRLSVRPPDRDLTPPPPVLPDQSAPAPAGHGVSPDESIPSGKTTAQAPTVPGWEENRWDLLLAQPGHPARNAALAAMLEQLASRDPDRALALAQAEGNLKFRERLIGAALRGWARLSPTKSAGWALALVDPTARETALSAVFAGAVAASPESAVQLGKYLFSQNPGESLGYGSRLIDALCDAGHFEIAAQLAGDGDQDQRSFWVAGAYSRWAEFQPEQAARAAAALSNPDLRNQALHGIVGGWAEADPAAMVQFAVRLPPETDRASIVSQALQYWVQHDAEAASQWINGREPGPEMDEGVAAVATMEFIQPEVAAGWAESIVNPKLRSETMAMVLRGWMATDLTAARVVFEATTSLLPEDRQMLAETVATLSGQPPSDAQPQP